MINIRILFLEFICLFSVMINCRAQIVTTIAGTTLGGFSGDGGAATAAKLNNPQAVKVDKKGNIYISDYSNNRLRKINTSGIISTIAGNGSLSVNLGVNGIAATSESFQYIYDIALDTNGNLYIAEDINNKIRKLNSTGIISTFGGNGSEGSPSLIGDGGPATSAEIRPYGITFDYQGNMLISDAGSMRIRKINTFGIINSLTEATTEGFSGDGGPATDAEIAQPMGIAVDIYGNIYFSDLNNQRIRKIDTFQNIYTVVGTGTAGYSGDGGVATAAKIHGVNFITVDKLGNLYLADYSNNVIRKVNSSGNIYSLNVSCNHPNGVALDTSGNMYICSNINLLKVTIPTININPIRNDSNCHGVIDTFVAIVANDAITPIYQWYLNGLAVGSNSSQIILDSLHEGDLMNCRLTYVFGDTVNVFSNTIRKHVYLPNTYFTCDTFLCKGAITTITSDSTHGTWSITNSKVSRSSSNVLSAISFGKDTISYSMTNACGSNTTTKIITVDTFLVNGGNIYGSTELCAGTLGTFSSNVLGGVWQSNHNPISVSGVVSALSSGTVSYLDTLIYTKTNACNTGITQTVITINPIPVPGIIHGNPTICQYNSTLLTDSGANDVGLWSTSNANAFVSSTGWVLGLVPGKDTVNFNVNNSCGIAIVTYIISINPLPHAGLITGNPTICTGSTITLIDSVTGGFWSSKNVNANIISGIVSGVYPGTDTLHYTVLNSCGTDTATFGIVVLPLPNAGSIRGDSSICVDNSILLNDSAIGGIWSALNSNLLVSPSGVIYGMFSGKDTINYTVINSCGTAIASKIITVLPLPQSGTILGTSNVCLLKSITLSDSDTGGIWDVSNPNASIVSGILVANFVGLDTVKYTVSNSCGVAISSFNVTILPLPNAGIILGTDSVCINTNVTLTDSITIGNWLVANNNLHIFEGIITGENVGLDTVYFINTNSCGTDTAIFFTKILPLPDTGNIYGKDSLCVGDSTTLLTNISGGVWNSSNSVVTITNGLVNCLTTGLDSIFYSITNSCGIHTTYHPILVSTLPDTPFISGLKYVCVSKQDTLYGYPLGGEWSATFGNLSLLQEGDYEIVSGIASGFNTLTYSITNYCGITGKSIEINVPSAWACDSISNLKYNYLANTEINIFPNPASTFINLNDAFDLRNAVNVKVRDIVGNLILEHNFDNNNGQLVIDVSKFDAGVYIIEYKKEKETIIKQFVKY